MRAPCVSILPAKCLPNLNWNKPIDYGERYVFLHPEGVEAAAVQFRPGDVPKSFGDKVERKHKCPDIIITNELTHESQTARQEDVEPCLVRQVL